MEEVPTGPDPVPEVRGERARAVAVGHGPDIDDKLDAILAALGVNPQTLEEEK